MSSKVDLGRNDWEITTLGSSIVLHVKRNLYAVCAPVFVPNGEGELTVEYKSAVQVAGHPVFVRKETSTSVDEAVAWCEGVIDAQEGNVAATPDRRGEAVLLSTEHHYVPRLYSHWREGVEYMRDSVIFG